MYEFVNVTTEEVKILRVVHRYHLCDTPVSSSQGFYCLAHTQNCETLINPAKNVRRFVIRQISPQGDSNAPIAASMGHPCAQLIRYRKKQILEYITPLIGYGIPCQFASIPMLYVLRSGKNKYASANWRTSLLEANRQRCDTRVH